MPDHQVLVVGGGLAGLNAAKTLAESDVAVTLLERADGVGGRVRTERADGFTFDRGFQVLFTAYPEVRRALDVEALDLRRFPPGAVVCGPNHRSVLSDPVRDPRGAIETLLGREVTLGDGLRTLSLRRRLAGTSRADVFSGPDTSIEDYLEQAGFSSRFVERFARPMYGGITLDRSLATSSRVFEFSFSMLARGYAAIPTEGMGAITEQLLERAKKAGATVRTNEQVTAVHAEDGVGRPGDAVTVQTATGTFTADAVVVATDPETSRDLTGVESIPVEARGSVTQYFAVPTSNPIASQKRLHLNAHDAVPTTVATLSAVAPSYSPDDVALVSASTPGADVTPEEDDEVLADRTRRVLASWYPEASVHDVELLRTVRVPFAQFAQPPGIHETLPEHDEPGGPVFLAGEFTEDSSIDGALASGRSAAELVRSALQE